MRRRRSRSRLTRGLQRTRAHLAVLDEDAGEFSCGGLLMVDGYHESEDGYVKRMTFEIHDGGAQYAVHTASSRLSQRGRIFVGNPSLMIVTWEEYSDAGGTAGKISSALRSLMDKIKNLF